jgi:alkylhydroperoxidase family enzyme
MPTLKPVDLETVSEKSQQLLRAIEQRVGSSSNMLRIMANSPAILETYVHFNCAFEKAYMPPKLRLLITMAVSQVMSCEYTLSIAATIGIRQGLSVEELEAARHAESNDPKIACALRFAARVVEQHGGIEPFEVDGLHQAGYSDEEIVEIIAAIALNLFRIYFNLIAQTEVDFPLVRVTEPLQKYPGQQPATSPR